uniref:Zinc finger, CCHC-type n=1 Tax=Tanacetum cinerariifolium TaxID=118510 RepID=A0A6L2JI93_TANCI|nr:zinc finger, CCHC-type [Tanacetum cinerariifolium]
MNTFECLWPHALHVKPWENEFESFSRKCLNEDICQLILRPYKIQSNYSIMYLFSNEIMPDVDVFRPRVLDIVVAESYGTFLSKYRGTAIAVSFGYQRPMLMVPWRYRKTRLTASSIGNEDSDSFKLGNQATVAGNTLTTTMAITESIHQATKSLLDKAKGNVLGMEIVRDQSGSLKANLQHMDALSTTKAGYMTFTEAWKKKIWLKGLLIESRYELSLVAGIATGALVKGGSRSKVPAQVEVAAEQHSAWELFNYREDSNEVAFAVAAVEKIYAHESLIFNNTVASTATGNAVTTTMAITESIHQGLLDKAKRNVLGMEIVRDQSGNTLRVSQSRFYNGMLVQTLLDGHSIFSLKGSLLGDCDVKKECLKANLQHMEALSTTEVRYMTFTEAWKKEIWLKGLLTESRYELRLVAGIAIGVLVKGGFRSEVPAQVKVAANRY